jgi:starch synthase
MGLKVLVCASEVVPFAKTGGLADVAGALPKALAALGHDVRVAMPRYSAIDGKKLKLAPMGAPFRVSLGANTEVSVFVSDAIPGVKTYLIDSPKHFDRKSLYGDADDGDRFALFSRAVLEFLRKSDWKPQVIHANDWQTGLMPVYLKSSYRDDPTLSPIATLYTIHNLAYQGAFGPEMLNRAGLDRSLFTIDGLEFYGQVNFMKGGLLFADLLSTVSAAYSREIQTAEYGERLEGVLAKRSADLFGVVNGIDYDEWNPASDPLLPARFNASDLKGKAANKAALQKKLGLPDRPDAPVFGLVSRLATQKGLDILSEVLPHLLQLDVQFALLGTGEHYYHDLLSNVAKQHPEKVGLVLGFDNALAHQIYAGSDFFLMPSRYEPCGLGQMISLRYGTVPIVRHTGGLADTVSDYNPQTERGNGFSFREHSAVALFGAISRALLTMRAAPAWQKLVQNAMASDFSWGRSAQAYVELYQRAIDRHGS